MYHLSQLIRRDRSDSTATRLTEVTPTLDTSFVDSFVDDATRNHHERALRCISHLRIASLHHNHSQREKPSKVVIVVRQLQRYDQSLDE
jgi:hypothetical protein